ncbi:cysteine methyltransferase [[Haemophilus] ducreyi]|uniref:Methylated-DNA--protein-cysteine methyltransferase n=2 Tax=Haemophilus ducreyi TaxID=730 RepID=Q7VMB3_HAEDU|nr:methylated-DNA--[protein]-cysteine S-methyltransferase [[Haemophilus] ducreyi]AAP95944.1 methylated-DNA--protein-cysteine S-methyltransferase [[Haemophilus] ducreyi 35000HP]AKO30951.1 cysteine methyltransferase [[Haemophilus] ducreyi]AKO32390.1 cysteine methyltransferase [[Haemophilus] ducreyi]AKO33842.1 cysteine methyltransferase [[Haemophilus] ducreyi]AKO35288.1 cysteine methyltransferase [[Haemophilus] ducreyi]
MNKNIYYQYYTSPVGQLLLIANQQGLIGVEFEQEQLTRQTVEWQPISSNDPMYAVFSKTCDLLDRYFAGEAVSFSQLDFLAPQGTAFQQAVWQALRHIPYGKTTSYGKIAVRLGKPKAMRAVGGAVGRNPISILVPCHRVLGKNNSLTGFGGGLATKRYLLTLEGVKFKDKGTEFVNPKQKKWCP